MPTYTLYQTATGQIVQEMTVRGEAQVAAACEALELSYREGAVSSQTASYIDPETGEELARPEIVLVKHEILANGADMIVFDVPGPFVISIDGVPYEAEDSFDLVSDMPGTYLVEIDTFPYLPFRTEIVAT